MDAVTPGSVGRITSLIGAPLGADVAFSHGEQLAWFKLHVKPSKSGSNPDRETATVRTSAVTLGRRSGLDRREPKGAG